MRGEQDGHCDTRREGWSLTPKCEAESDWLDCDPCATKEDGVCDAPGLAAFDQNHFSATCPPGSDFVDCHPSRASECRWERRCATIESRQNCEAAAHRGCDWDEGVGTQECKFSKTKAKAWESEQSHPGGLQVSHRIACVDGQAPRH